MKNNYTIVIPIHEFNETNEKLLVTCLNSIKNQKYIDYKPNLLIVTAASIDKQVKKILKTFDTYLDYDIIINTSNTSVQNQLNFASNYIKTKYFMFLEFDDELSVSYLNRFDKYYDEVSHNAIILCMLINVDENNKPIDFSNEVAWSMQFSGDELGYINLDSLKEYSNFKLSGCFIDTAIFKSVGMLKNNIKLSFNYEFMLRVLNSGYKIFVIPKIGCKHFEGRDGSLFNNYFKNMTIKERGFWFDVAKKEYFFNNDRIIKEIE